MWEVLGQVLSYSSYSRSLFRTREKYLIRRGVSDMHLSHLNRRDLKNKSSSSLASSQLQRVVGEEAVLKQVEDFCDISAFLGNFL